MLFLVGTHVPEPCEVVEKDGEKKIIFYSMGNFISNQRLETVDDIWTERGLLLDVTFEKQEGKHALKMCLPTRRWFGFGARALLVLKVLPCLITARWF